MIDHAFIHRLYRPLQPGAASQLLWYQEYAPSATLRPWVYCYWTLAGAASPAQYAVVADGCVDIILNCAPPYDTWVAGSATAAFRVDLPAGSTYFGVRLLPGTLTRLFACAADEVTNALVPAELVLGPSFRQWAERMQSADLSQHQALTDAWLQGRLAAGGAPALDAPLARALYHVLGSRGNARIEHEVADWVGPRQLRRLFARHVGLAPKVFARIVRFQAALRILHASPSADWSSAVVGAGYFDQPHLLREFRQFHGRLT
jgi:Helix-turn-helix domain